MYVFNCSKPGQFASRAMYIYDCISPSVGKILLKIPIWESTNIHYKLCKFGCDRSTIKVSSLEEQYTSSAASQLPLE
jgi:hypothetical protein